MKRFVQTILIVLLLISRLSTVAAFGPHGDGKIGSARERLELPRGIPAYQHFTSPLSYPSMTRRDLNPILLDGEVIEVEGSSSKVRLFVPVGFLFGLSPTTGLSFDVKDRSIRAAIDDAKKRYGVRALYDIRIDKRIFSILGIYNKTTTLVHAKGIRERGRSPESLPQE